MKQNLEADNNNEENKKYENIDFNYKFVLSKNLVKNKLHVDPYQDYKEFFIMTKKKNDEKKINSEKHTITDDNDKKAKVEFEDWLEMKKKGE